MTALLEQALGETALHDTARKLGFFARLRAITPHRLILSLLLTLATQRVETLADLHRGFVATSGVAVTYKPFFNQLAKPAFARLMQAVLARLIKHLVLQVLVVTPGSPLAEFDDVLAHDSTEFRLPDWFQARFPGRYPVKACAVAALHVTLSLRRDQPVRVQLTSQRAAAKLHRPHPTSLRKKLFLGDRAYADCLYVVDVAAAGGSCLVRATKRINPKIRGGYVGERAWEPACGAKFQAVLAQAAGQHLDLDVEFPRSRRRPKVCRVRLLALWNPQTQAHLLLLTNLPRERFSAAYLGELYALRWQVELLFKEWKSYANLHAFSTEKETIATGLIWAALAAAFLKRFCAHATAHVYPGTAISTRTTAMALGPLLAEVLRALARGRGIQRELRRLFAFLHTQARRTQPKREHTRGRGRTGLRARGTETPPHPPSPARKSASLAPLVA